VHCIVHRKDRNIRLVTVRRTKSFRPYDFHAQYDAKTSCREAQLVLAKIVITNHTLTVLTGMPVV